MERPEEPPNTRHLKSPFTKLISTRYYDGPLEGFLAHREWSQACVFQLVDWDRETDLRVYEISRVEDTSFDDVVALLFRERLPTWPVWVLPSNVRERGAQLVDECSRRARLVATVTTRDLFGEITLWETPDDAAVSSASQARQRPQETG